MGWGNHHEMHGESEQEQKQRRITEYINERLGETVGARDQHKEVAAEVSDKFGVLLTPTEVKDIHTSGW